ncbi:MAG TPA: hypothetical protein VFP84_03585 [Kofleriaceae bacterium]|nr:hypothetical protein [Kofleriaceae bacterium]
MKFYYAHPTPDRLVDEVVALDRERKLDPVERRIVVATFLGRVFAANPARVPAWLDTLADQLLSEGARNTLQLAAYFSNTVESREWMVRIGGKPEDQQPAPELLVAPVREAVMLDALWAYYFATGNALAVRKVITVLGLVGDAGAALAFEGSARTALDEERANNDTLYQAASWSIAALTKEHPPLLAMCEQIFEMPDMTNDERLGLAVALERSFPERWRVEVDPATRHVRVHKLAD